MTDNTWDIIIPINEEQYKYITNKSNESDYEVTIKFRNEGIESTGKLSCFINDEEYFGKIRLDNYMEKFAGQRFVEIELRWIKIQVLKSPILLLLIKNFIKFPMNFFTGWRYRQSWCYSRRCR